MSVANVAQDLCKTQSFCGVASAPIKRGSQVELADGRQGVVRSITARGVIEVRGGWGVVLSHVDCVSAREASR
jgi:hypothetical protein